MQIHWLTYGIIHIHMYAELFAIIQ